MSQATQEKNKALVLDAFETLFNRRDYAAAERFWSPGYIQHSAHIVPGRDGLFDLVRNLSPIMNRFRRVPIAAVVILGLSSVLVGCARAPAEATASAPLPVMVSHPVERDVTDYADFTARTAAVDSVEVRAHVWGYLDKVNFKEGDAGQEGRRPLRDRPAALPGAAGPGRRPRSRRMKAQLRRATRSEYRGTTELIATRGRVARRSSTRPRRRGASISANIAADKAAVASRPSWTWNTPRSPRRSAAAPAATSSPWAT